MGYYFLLLVLRQALNNVCLSTSLEISIHRPGATLTKIWGNTFFSYTVLCKIKKPTRSQILWTRLQWSVGVWLFQGLPLNFVHIILMTRGLFPVNFNLWDWIINQKIFGHMGQSQNCLLCDGTEFTTYFKLYHWFYNNALLDQGWDKWTTCYNKQQRKSNSIITCYRRDGTEW